MDFTSRPKEQVLIIWVPALSHSLSQPPTNPDNTYSSQKLKCQKSRTTRFKRRNVVEPLLCLTAVPKTCPQTKPTYLQAKDLHPLCDDLGQPQDLPKSCETSCHYKEQKNPALGAGAEKCTNAHATYQKRPSPLAHNRVRHHARKCWKDPAARKTASPAGVGVWVCFYGNAKKHSQEQPHHADETNCCQGKTAMPLMSL